MRIIVSIAAAALLLPWASLQAVTPAEDIATTIVLRGHPCGQTVTDVTEVKNDDGSMVIQATCPDGKRYRVDVSKAGKVKVTPQ